MYYLCNLRCYLKFGQGATEDGGNVILHLFEFLHFILRPSKL